MGLKVAGQQNELWPREAMEPTEKEELDGEGCYSECNHLV